MSTAEKKTRLLIPALVVSAALLGLGAYLFWSPGGGTDSALPLNANEYVKRITNEQYRNIVRDIFGGAVVMKNSLPDPIKREEGLLAVGAARARISTMGFQAAEEIAYSIASQIVSEANRKQFIGCGSQPSQFDENCARQFISAVGRLFYRRPLMEQELEEQVEWARKAAKQNNDFYAGIERSLVNMLVSPNFLFRVESTEPDPERAEGTRLTAFSKASRLSFLLWNSAPDSVLLDAAERGELHSRKGLERQVDRMLRSTRLEHGVRGFFSDMLALDGFKNLSKDAVIFPKFTLQVTNEAPEQMLRMLLDHLLVQQADYRDLFTTNKTFLTPSLAAMLGVPLLQMADETKAPDYWQPYEFPEGDPRAGLLAQPAFVALHSHPGRTSPTLRGKALRENLLCQTVPDPPPNVDFKLVQANSHEGQTTMRQRLTAHATNPTCAGCHKITDPIGLALETFDGAGAYRTKEQGLMIDTSGELDGVTYDDAPGLAQSLRDNPNVTSCVVNRVFSYGVGREVQSSDRKWLKDVRQQFAENGYKFMNLLRVVATSEAFYRS